MQLRTEIERPHQLPTPIGIDSGIVMLGSCFTDNVGERLERDGFKVARNPLGPLYNPSSIAKFVVRAISGEPYGPDDFVEDADGRLHCLDFASRYSGNDPLELSDTINSKVSSFAQAIKTATTAIFTLGTAYVYRWREDSTVVGNCHKFPAGYFDRRRLSVSEVADELQKLLDALPANIKNVIFTVSPIRHLADGLHGNQLSKATLLLGIDSIADPRASYFPAYEIVLDDLRDYRFYQTDMKHPSELAVDYIYELFLNSCCTKPTIAAALDNRKEALRRAHRPIIET